MQRKTVAILVSAVFLGIMAPAMAQSVYHVPLFGGQVVPPVETESEGGCVGVFSDVNDTLTLICEHDVGDATAAHVHEAIQGENGPVKFTFDDVESPFKGSWNMTPDDVMALKSGGLYVQIHSQTNPPGELRGQLGAPTDRSNVFPLSGQQVVPPVETDNAGFCAGVMNFNARAYHLVCTHNVEDVTQAHIHRGAEGLNGEVIFALEAATTQVASITPEAFGQTEDCLKFDDFLRLLRNGNLYVNIHSTGFPGGELRGQIPPPPVARYAPQVIDGLGFSSDIVLVNPSVTSAIQAVVAFNLMNGAPWEVGFANGPAGSGGVMFQSGTNSVAVELDPLGSATISTDGDGLIDEAVPLGLGSAKITSTGPLGAVVRLNSPEEGSISGFGTAVPLRKAVAPAARDASVNTALAIRNASGQGVNLTLELRNEAGVVPNANHVVTVQLAPRARIARFINELFPDADTTDFKGSVVITTDVGAFAAAALEQLGGNSTLFTSLPVTPLILP
jgi:hypothetical protein